MSMHLAILSINGPLEEQFIVTAPASASAAIRGARSPQPMLAPQRHCCEKMATPENGSEFVYRRKISTCFIATDKISAGNCYLYSEQPLAAMSNRVNNGTHACK